jgi:hypothetical protein
MTIAQWNETRVLLWQHNWCSAYIIHSYVLNGPFLNVLYFPEEQRL